MTKIDELENELVKLRLELTDAVREVANLQNMFIRTVAFHISYIAYIKESSEGSYATGLCTALDVPLEDLSKLLEYPDQNPSIYDDNSFADDLKMALTWIREVVH